MWWTNCEFVEVGMLIQPFFFEVYNFAVGA